MTAVPHTFNGDLDEFRARAQEWVAKYLPPLTPEFVADQDKGDGSRALELQAQLYEAGFAGICWPREYGGQGLPPPFQIVFNEVVRGREMPIALNMTLGIVGPTLLEIGSEEQRSMFVPEMLRGEAIWCQLFSEPSGGSDLAGVLTKAERDGNTYRLTGSKIWTSSAFRAARGVCLARTDASLPKHRGLTMFIVDMDSPGLEVRRIKKADGDERFCGEYLDGVAVESDRILGEENGGWSVALALLAHERAAIGGSSIYLSGPGYRQDFATADPLVNFVRSRGLGEDAHVRQLVAEAHANRRVADVMSGRIRDGVRAGILPPSAGSMARLAMAMTHVRRNQIEMSVQGACASILRRDVGQDDLGLRFLVRQATCLGGGSVEMQRNIISERVMGLPREYAPDKDRPFDQVPVNRHRRGRP